MNDKPGQADDIAMKGGGYYSLATIGAKDVINAATPLVLDAVAQMDLADSRGFTMSDMGCADGGTSIEMVGQSGVRVMISGPRAVTSTVSSDLAPAPMVGFQAQA